MPFSEQEGIYILSSVSTMGSYSLPNKRTNPAECFVRFQSQSVIREKGLLSRFCAWADKFSQLRRKAASGGLLNCELTIAIVKIIPLEQWDFIKSGCWIFRKSVSSTSVSDHISSNRTVSCPRCIPATVKLFRNLIYCIRNIGNNGVLDRNRWNTVCPDTPSLPSVHASNKPFLSAHS